MSKTVYLHYILIIFLKSFSFWYFWSTTVFVFNWHSFIIFFVSTNMICFSVKSEARLDIFYLRRLFESLLIRAWTIWEAVTWKTELKKNEIVSWNKTGKLSVQNFFTENNIFLYFVFFLSREMRINYLDNLVRKD